MKKDKREIFNMSTEFKELMNETQLDEQLDTAKNFFSEIDDRFKDVLANKEIDVSDYINNYERELESIRVDLVDESDKLKDDLKGYLTTTFGTEEANEMMSKVDDVSSEAELVDIEEIKRIEEEARKQLEEKQEKEAEMIEKINEVTESLIVTSAIFAVVSDIQVQYGTDLENSGVDRDSRGPDIDDAKDAVVSADIDLDL